MNIKPISELRNYGKLMEEVTTDEPLILTKNGTGAYAVITMEDFEEFEKYKTLEFLKKALEEGHESAEKYGLIDGKEFFKEFEKKYAKYLR